MKKPGGVVARKRSTTEAFPKLLLSTNPAQSIHLLVALQGI
jgi:hypothetical protein